MLDDGRSCWLPAAAALAGCSAIVRPAPSGFIRDAPDEFTVTTRAPLAMPPNFALPRPSPVQSRPQEQSERAKAEQALVPQMALGDAGQRQQPGPAGAGAGGRTAGVARNPHGSGSAGGSERPSKELHRQTDVLAQAAAARDRGGPPKEAQRLRENSALGQSPETGDTPIVQPKQRGWLEGIF